MRTRRLAAIIVADVVGYSAMMAVDAEATLATLKAHRTTTDPIILNHGGRIVKTTGDGMVVEVPSAIQAVRAAVATQRTMAARNAELPAERRMAFRIGVDVGDVIVDDDGDVYGDGVNVAARLEPLAEPGGICVSDSVHRHVRGQLSDVDFHDLGEHELKNIPGPVRAWSVGLPEQPPARPTLRPFSPDTTVGVLPFEDRSGSEVDDGYFADGITEDLITALSYEPELQVVARSSTFAYRGRELDARILGRRLDARYLVNGSVRRAGDRLRITAQLVETETGRQVWAERYDRDLEDVFALQDEIVAAVRGRVAVSVRQHEGRRVSAARPEDLDSWELLKRARWHAHRLRPEDMAEAVSLAEQALALGGSPSAHYDLGGCWYLIALSGWRVGDRRAIDESERHVELAYAAEPDDALINSLISLIRSFRGDGEEALAYAARSVELNPHIWSTWTALSHAECFHGDPAAAIDAGTEAWRLGTHEPHRWHVGVNLAFAHYLLGSYEASLRWSTEVLKLADYFQGRLIAAAALGRLGRPAEAQPHLEAILGLRPDLTATGFGEALTWRRPEDAEHVVDGLVAAGLPR